MSVLKCWAAGACLMLALAQGANADMTVSQSNDPSAALGVSLKALLGQERSGLGAVSGARLTEIAVTPVAQPAAKARRKGAKAADEAPAYDAAWLAAQPSGKGGPEFTCLATALYFEARGEGIKGQAAVGEVILNRLDSGYYPGSICGVVNQRGNGGCQFSYTCDGVSDGIADRASWDRASRIAFALMAGAPRTLTGGATHFHTPAVRPDWSRRFAQTARIGRHIFYREPIRTAMN